MALDRAVDTEQHRLMTTYGVRGICCFLMLALAARAVAEKPSYPVVDTGQSRFYDSRREIAKPKPGDAFYGQDAQFNINPPAYTLGPEGLTVRDNVTGLTWQRSPDTDGDGVIEAADKLTLSGAEALPARLNATKFGGFSDWRLPTIKELFSLFNGNGIDPSGPMDMQVSRLVPFIDTNFFRMAYGDAKAGERLIDCQYASSTRYVGKGIRGADKLFGVNFADGRIKGYDLLMPGRSSEKTFFLICVRGNPSYGKNKFHDNGDGTISDHATGLLWAKTDSGQGMNWEEALAWVQRQNKENYLGRKDWRLPTVKELQSIVDYTRSPATSKSAAIDPLFTCAAVTNEVKELDYPFYWSSTTHQGMRGGDAAMYVAFGRAAGWMSPMGRMPGPPGGGRPGPGPGGGKGFGPPPRPPAYGNAGAGAGEQGPGASGDYRYTDVHGAGAQRSDPKSGDPAMFPHGRGPQGDVIRIYNYVRLVAGPA